jgi:hypothetical protein
LHSPDTIGNQYFTCIPTEILSLHSLVDLLTKPPFPSKQCRNINLHEMSAFEFLQVHTHESDPASDETINEDSPDGDPVTRFCIFQREITVK